MLKHFLMWALLCTTAPFMRAQNQVPSDSTVCDTTEYFISPRLLDEIVITADPVINKTDRKVIRPNKEILNASSGGIDLLRKLQLPRITVNPMTNEITAANGGSVIMCINGVESTSAQIAAIRPEDIMRIEYHDRPGVRYAEAVAVIDYITSRHDAGGNVSLDAFGAFASRRYASIDHFAGQYNRGRAVWSVNVGYMGQQRAHWIRDYEETWNYPDKAVSRHETGLPVTIGGAGMESLLNYNYLHPDGNMFNLRLGFDFNNVPNKEEGDRHTLLETSATDVPVMVIEHTEEKSLNPNIGMYYRHTFTEGQELAIDLQGSYLHSRMLHGYSENGIGETSRVNGRKASVKFLGIYEKRMGSRVWSAGASSQCSFVRNVYRLDESVNMDVNQSQTALFGEYSDRFGNWGAMCNLRAAYNHLGQEGHDIDRFFLLPSATLSYRPAKGWFLRYAASLDYLMPSASEISGVTQPVQTGMIRRGNPGLKPFRITDQTFSASFESRPVSIEARLEYRNEHNPVMESVIFEDNTFVRTYFNQRSFQRLRAGTALSVHPWKEHLSITVEPTLTRYFSHGRNYSHCQSIFRTGIGVDFSYGNWLAYGNILSGPANKMYGEEIIEEKDMSQIMAGYKRNAWSIHLGIFNALTRNYWMETRNLSTLTPYTSKAHSGGGSAYIALKLNITLSFGRKGREVEIPANDTDKDTGILSGTK